MRYFFRQLAYSCICATLFVFFVSCQLDKKPVVVDVETSILQRDTPPGVDRNNRLTDSTATISFTNHSATPNSLLAFAETLIGKPYVYGSSDPEVGFDCSGFITYVFGHFKIAVPRSSIDFTNVGKPVSVGTAKKGDIILFTGTNPSERFVGHMGLVVSNDTTGLHFIHSSSGKVMGVTVSALDVRYLKRFIGVRRIFTVNDSR